MTPEEAKQALKLSNTDDGPPGFWTYVLVPLDDQYGGKVIHFWPWENHRERHYGQRVENGGIATMVAQEYHSVCNLDTQKGDWIVPRDDWFSRRRLPRCKRCVKKLVKLSKSNHD